VVVEGAAPPQRFSVKVRDDESGIDLDDNFFRTDGKWRITNVPQGSYEVSVESAEGNAKTEVELAAGEDKGGIELELAGTVTVTGTLVDLDTGEPVPGMKVSVGGRTGSFRFDDSTTKEKKEISDAQGRFEVQHAPVGPGRLVVSSFGFADSDYGWAWVPIVIPKGVESHQLEPTTLVKKRTTDDERRGSLGLKIKQGEPGEEDEDRRHIVAFVRPGGAADKAGIEVGEEITKVDGHDVTGVDAYRYGSLVNAPPGHELTLTVGEGRDVRVKLGPPE
jgi:hypothetical protein